MKYAYIPFGNSGVLQNLPLWISRSPEPSKKWSWTKNPSANPVGLFLSFVISVLYDDVIIFNGELILSASEYPKGPYIGLPSYAQPMIGEWPVIWLNSPLEFVVNVFSKFSAISCE